MIACLFSCEHATCAVPEAFRETFRGSEETVASTKGWDPGALNLAQGFSMKFRTPLVHGDVTRLLIDLNEEGDLRWSDFSGKLPEATRAKLVDRHERPYRMALNSRIAEDLTRHQKLVHLM
ncbi:MAG: N-formylglutamate amidohydrolase, partial [Alphaproteobacteria bacterium]